MNALYAVAQHDAIGFAPFGIESISGDAATALAQSYELLGALAPTLLASQGRAVMAGLLPEIPVQPQPQLVRLGGYGLQVTYERQAGPSIADGAVPSPPAPPRPAGGLVVATAPDEFFFAGTGITVTFAVAGPAHAVVGILSAEEGTFANGQWVHRRWLNGDQTHQGRHVRLEPGRFSIQRVRLYRYREP